MKPSWSRREGAVHLSYELPSRVHTAQIYPILAPNGSSIIVYGHERGLTVLWRGGRPFRHVREPASARREGPRGTQQASNDAIMIIDSDEEKPSILYEQPKASNEDSVFDSEEEEFDSSEPYDKIIDTLDISTGEISVLHLAIPSIPSDGVERIGGSLPPILTERVVVAAVCSDSSLRLFSIPLAPSPQSPDRHSRDWQRKHVQDVIIFEPRVGPRHVPRGISITWTAKQIHATSTELEDGGERQAEVEAGNMSSQTHSHPRRESTKWSLLVASHSAEAGGVLSVHQCPLHTGNSQISQASISLLQRVPLHNPATIISFSSSHYPSKRHTQLLVADSKGVVRIYDQSPRPRLHSGRSTRDYDQSLAGPQGIWLASLFPPFEQATKSVVLFTAGPQRIRIIDARWAFDGTCIVVLLADEQWGLWDIEGVGPTGTRSLTRTDADGIDTSLSAGSITGFALRGFVGDSADARSAKPVFNESASLTNSSARGSGRLAPMTPNTRKSKQQQLFSGPAAPSSIPGLVRGGVSLSAAPNKTPGNTWDECLVLWYGNSVFAIPSLMTYWQRVAGSSGTSQDTGALLGPNITRITAISSSGEMLTSISQPPQRFESGALSSRPPSSQHIRHDLLVSTEHRLVLLCPIKERERSTAMTENMLQAEEENSEDDDGQRLDQALLRRQELDLQGLDRFLDGMTNGSSTRNPNLGDTARGRRVGFAANS